MGPEGDAEAFAIRVVQNVGSAFYRDGLGFEGEVEVKDPGDDNRNINDSTSDASRKMLPGHLRVDHINCVSGKQKLRDHRQVDHSNRASRRHKQRP